MKTAMPKVGFFLRGGLFMRRARFAKQVRMLFGKAAFYAHVACTWLAVVRRRLLQAVRRAVVGPRGSRRCVARQDSRSGYPSSAPQHWSRESRRGFRVIECSKPRTREPRVARRPR